jgi:SAM-dependent methyltransferase
MLGPISDQEKCILITCGDNNGAMNYKLRELGGKWSWADHEDICIDEMSTLLGEKVVQFEEEDKLPFEDASFDRVVTIDVHEHIDDPLPFTKEVHRITKPGGQVIMTVPNGDESKLAVRIKNAVGMTPEAYGHSRVGLRMSEMKKLMQDSGFEPKSECSFSRIFTELLELSINFAYVKILAKKSKAKVEEGQIAPATQDQMKSVKKSYKMYSLIYPFYNTLSKLDNLIAFTEGYVVVVEGKRST